MSPRRCPELLLLWLAGASLFFGGGVGCTPDVRGVDLRPASVLSIPGDPSSPLDWYVALTGRGAPGTAIAGVPYRVNAPFRISARFGVFLPELRHDTEDARGCVGFADRASSEDFRVCIRVYPIRIRVFSNLDGTYPNFAGDFADCLEDSHVEIALEDDGETVTASYRCDPGDAFATLLTADSKWEPNEDWDPFFSASDIRRGAQLGMDDLRIETTAPEAVPDPDPEESAAFETLTAFSQALESFYALEAEDLDGAVALAELAQAQIDAADARDTAADKLVAKAASTHARQLDTLLAGAIDKYQKAFAKLAALDANALEALAAGF
jgi:hypothetical protein